MNSFLSDMPLTLIYYGGLFIVLVTLGLYLARQERKARDHK